MFVRLTCVMMTFVVLLSRVQTALYSRFIELFVLALLQKKWYKVVEVYNGTNPNLDM